MEYDAEKDNSSEHLLGNKISPIRGDLKARYCIELP
jgi:hypothetical protein